MTNNKEIIYWLKTVMVPGQAYSVTERQVKMIKELWDELNDNEFEFKFSSDYKQIKKTRI